jgi:hypothetical protein
MRITGSLLALLMIAGCTDMLTRRSAGREITEIGIKRSTCGEDCPAYEAVITRDGVVHYTGASDAGFPGSWTAKVPVRDVDELAALFDDERERFFEFQDQYGEPGSHFGPVVLSIVRNGRRKTVVNYGFHRPAGPFRLQWLECAVTVLVEHRSSGWSEIRQSD